MTIPILVANSTQAAAGTPLARNVYAARIIYFAQGAKIGFQNDPSTHRTVRGLAAYMSDQPFEVWSSGAELEVEYVTKKDFKHIFEGGPGGLIVNKDAAGNVTVTGGGAADGAAAGPEIGVMAGGKMSDGTKESLSLAWEGEASSAVHLGAVVPVGRDLAGTMRSLAAAAIGSGLSSGLGRVARPLLVQPHDAGDVSEKGFLFTYQLAPGANSAGFAYFWSIISGASLHLYIRQIRLTSLGTQTAAGVHQLQLPRISAHSGGTDAAPWLSPTWGVGASPLFSGTAKVNPAGITEEMGSSRFDQFFTKRVVVPATANEATLNPSIVWDFSKDPIRCPAGGHGVAFKQLDGVLAAGQTGYGIECDFFERSY